MLLEVRSVTKKFGGLIAISNFSFVLEKGIMTSLIGPNGAGKTTLFNIINGIYPPTSGSIIFDGKDITGLKPNKIARSGIGRTFQTPRLFNEFTTLKNVISAAIYGGGIRDIREAKKRGIELLDFVGLEKKKDVLAKNLLATEKKYLELARALAIRPKLLLLDELFAGLGESDTSNAINLLFKIKNDMGITIFMIEHNIKAVMKISEKVIVIHHGEKIAEGVPKDVAQNPEVIKAYLGEEYA